MTKEEKMQAFLDASAELDEAMHDHIREAGRIGNYSLYFAELRNILDLEWRNSMKDVALREAMFAWQDGVRQGNEEYRREKK